MSEKLIECQEVLTGSQDDDTQMQNVFLKHCFDSSKSELNEFVGELSELTSLPCMPSLSHLCDESSRNYLRLNLQKWNATLSNFASLLITVVIMRNLNHFD